MNEINVCFLGFGAVAKTVFNMWPIIMKSFMNKVVIIEPTELNIERYVNKEGPTYYKEILCYKIFITRHNYDEVLTRITQKHQINLIIDLSVNVDSLDMIAWGQHNKIPYINTALEDWKEFEKWDGAKTSAYEHTLYARHKVIRDTYTDRDCTTMVLEMGMNPGLISHFAKQALHLIAAEKISNNDDGYNIALLQHSIDTNNHAEIAKALNLATIQIAEHDTQVSMCPKYKDTFYNTWSCIGFVEESTDPAQLGWGTHEKTYPESTIIPELVFNRSKTQHQIFLAERGMNVKVQSYEPISGEFTGFCISHGEASSLSYFLQTDDYRPSVYYVYLPCAGAIESLNQLRERNYIMQNNYVIHPSREIAGGYDSVGALMLFNNNKTDTVTAFWAGTIVRDNFAKKISPEINATTVQVACGVLAGINHILKYPKSGVKFPEELDTKEIFDLVSPWLSEIRWEWLSFVPKSAKFVDLRV